MKDQEDFPVDSIWSSDYMDSRIPFSMNSKAKSSLEPFVRKLNEKEIYFVPIVSFEYPVQYYQSYEHASQQDVLIKIRNKIDDLVPYEGFSENQMTKAKYAYLDYISPNI